MSRTVTRRAALAGGGLVIVAAGGALGTVVGLRRQLPVVAPPVPPAALVTAVARERQLLAGLDATIAAGSGQPDKRLAAVRADHAAHLDALNGALALATQAGSAPRATSPSPSPPAAPAVQPAGIAELRAAETAAATAATHESDALTGDPAVLLASIAASEAGHAELLA